MMAKDVYYLKGGENEKLHCFIRNSVLSICKTHVYGQMSTHEQPVSFVKGMSGLKTKNYIQCLAPL